MKRLIALLLLAFSVSAQIPMGSTWSGANSNVMLADMFINMNTSSPGTTLSPTIMANGTLNNQCSSWTMTPSTPTGFTVGSHSSSRVLPSAVIAAGINYPTSTTSQSMSLANSAATTYVDCFLPSGHQTVTVSGWITLGVPVNGSSGLAYDLVRMNSTQTGNCIMQLIDGPGSGNYGARIEVINTGTTTSPMINLTSGSTYWYTFKCDSPNSLASLAIYDTSLTQVGSTQTLASFTSHPVGEVLIGNSQTGTSTGSNVFENTLISYNGVFPQLPAAAPPIYFVDSNSNHTTSSGTAVAVTMPSTTTGNGIVCAAFWNSTSRTGSVADVANGSYTAVDSPVTVIGSYRLQTYYKMGITGATTPAITFTMSGSAAAIDRNIACHEVHGISSLDKHPAVHAATGATMTSNASTTTASANEYLFSACVVNGTAQDPWVQSGSQLWNLRELANFEGNPTADAIVTGTGNFTFTGFQDTSTTYGCALNTFQ